jgi:hypothetical protein
MLYGFKDVFYKMPVVIDKSNAKELFLLYFKHAYIPIRY